MQINDNGCGGFFVHAPNFDIKRTFECGQAFRFKERESEYPCEFCGVAYGRFMRFASDGEGNVHIFGAERGEVESLWLHYLSLDVDYERIKAQILADFDNHPFMSAAIEQTGGLRILSQERFETLCSFIISQNNNIPRISKIIESICARYGDKIDTPYGEKYAFPTPKQLAVATEEELSALKMGYRARYIANAARAVASGELDLESLTAQNAREELLKLVGVGEKVAACIRLFAIGDMAAFPVDVWIRRVSERRFGGALTAESAGRFGGVAQQYLFCYERELAGSNV